VMKEARALHRIAKAPGA